MYSSEVCHDFEGVTLSNLVPSSVELAIDWFNSVDWPYAKIPMNSTLQMAVLTNLKPHMVPAVFNLDVGKPFWRGYYCITNEALPFNQVEKRENLSCADRCDP